MTTPASLPPISLTHADVFGAAAGAEKYFEVTQWDREVTFFVGRNGSGKSRTAKLLATRVAGARLLSTDRLVGLMNFTNYGWGSAPADYRGVPLDEASRPHIEQVSRAHGAGTEELYALREQPEVWLRVSAFLRRALHRSIELRESAGFLDPFVRLGSTEYSLLRDEGHGLREIVILLAAVYRNDWSLLVVDEPELHLHPSLARLWLSELQGECARTGRRAIVTHEPSLINPVTIDDLESVVLFQPGKRPKTLRNCVDPTHEERVTASLAQNPAIVSQLVFSPRPVLVEGVLDVTALSVALRRTQAPEAISQTDVIDCGGNGGLAVWFTVSRNADLDVRAIGDLDCCLDNAVTRAIDKMPDITTRYQRELFIEPPKTATVIRPLIDAMRAAEVPTDQKSRAEWLARDMGKNVGDVARRDKLLEIWRDAGLWLHKTGTLESLLGLSTSDKTRELVAAAASRPGEIDLVATWAAYLLDPSGDVFELLGVAVEHVAHGILEALRLAPGEKFNRAVGGTATGDSRIVDVSYVTETGRHRITVKLPSDYTVYWVEFDRNTPPADLALTPPVQKTD